MKISFFKNDKQTAWDELILFLIVVACLTVGILLIVYRPAFWMIHSELTAGFGLAIVILGVMYLPCLIYRLLTNHRK